MCFLQNYPMVSSFAISFGKLRAFSLSLSTAVKYHILRGKKWRVIDGYKRGRSSP